MRLKKIRIVAILLAMLMVTLPFSSAFLFDLDEREKEANVGEAIIVNVKEYEPVIIPSSLIEDGDVPIHAFLTGITTARLLGTEANFEPFYGQALIKQVYTRPLNEDTQNAVRGRPAYIPPKEYTMDNLGYLVITLKQIEREDEVPDNIELNMYARVTFENIERLYSLIQQDLILPEEEDEAAWRASPQKLDESSFFSKRGFMRATEIGPSSATITLYAGSDMVWPYTGAPRPIKSGLRLRKGETSDYYRLSEMQGYMTNAFRVKLVDIIDPMRKRAKLEVTIDGTKQQKVVTVGSKIHPTSKLTVRSIDVKKESGKTVQIVTIYDPYGYSGTKSVIRTLSGTPLIPGEEGNVEDDPCENKGILLDDMEDAGEWLAKLQGSTQDVAYCATAAAYRKVIGSYYGIADEKGILFEDIANFRLGQIYEELDRPVTALEHYRKAVRSNKGNFIPDARDRIEKLQKEIGANAISSHVDFEDHGRTISVRVLDVLWQDEGSQPYVIIDMLSEGTKNLEAGKNIFHSDFEENGYNFNWRISRISSDHMMVEKHYIDNVKPSDYRAERKTIYAGQSDTIEGQQVFVREINMRKFALVSVIPGSGLPMESVSNFTIHIPVEKRMIQWTPNEISSKINSTKEIIKDLDDIIDKLDSVVKTWKTLCMGTFAYLTIKNSFFTGLARNQARKHAMNGVDGQSGWDSYCRSNSGTGKAYSSYEDCIMENAGRIEQTIDESQKAIEQVNDDMEKYKEKEWYLELGKDYKKLDKYQKYMGEDLHNMHELRNYRYNYLMKQSTSYSGLTGEQLAEKGSEYNFKKEIDEQLREFNHEKNAAAFNKAVEAIEGGASYGYFESLTDEEKGQLFSDLYNANKEDTIVELDDFKYVEEIGAITVLSKIRQDKGRDLYAYTPTGKKDDLKEVDVQWYAEQLKEKSRALETEQGKYQAGTSKHIEIQNSMDKLNAEVTRVTDNYINNKNSRARVTTSEGQLYKDGGGNLYVAKSLAYSVGRLNKNYNDRATVEVYPGGRPYCVPTCEGNYVKVLDFYKDGSPKTLAKWNVGDDGMLCTNDDQQMLHPSVLDRPEYESELNNLNNVVDNMGRHKPGDSLSFCGRQFLVAGSRAKAETAKTQPNCYDTMDPGDCRLLFGVCDPVMCPPSRFNMGGTWQVDDVVQTGLIGSMILGYQLFDIPYEPVPICLTGVLAGLQNIKSVLRGYVECLNTALVHGKSVGICDKIRSVFICDLIWREAIAILRVKGGLLTKIAQFLIGEEEGGGEYLTFQSSLQNVADSVSFFTKSYATTAFAAYNSRSFSEIGATVCKQAIFGKFPALGDFIDQITEPESPPQYTALVTEMPFSETLQRSRYQVFYHIYAGEDKEATYSVWLEDSTKTMTPFYATERCEGRRGDIGKGGIASQNLDCIAPTGYDRVCISVNGRTECGFGKVSTSFALDYVNDLVVADEAQRKISTEEECYPSVPITSPSLLSIPLPGEISMLSTGIVRVCSLNNPGKSTNAHDWQMVGDCGKDDSGRSLGRCWLDMRTVSIKDTERMEDVRKTIADQGYDKRKAELGVTDSLDESESRQALAIANKIAPNPDEAACLTLVSASYAYSHLTKVSIVPAVSAEAQYKKANMLKKAAEKCAKLNLEKIKRQFREDAERIYRQYATQYKEASAEDKEIIIKSYINNLGFKKIEVINKVYPAVADDKTFDLFEEEIKKILHTYLDKELRDAPAASSKTAAAQKATEEARCEQCKASATDECTKSECGGLGDCYWKEGTFANSCSPISTAQCSDMEDDKAACLNSGRCKYGEVDTWLGMSSKWTCIEKTTAVSSTTAGNPCLQIIGYAEEYLDTGYGGTGDCPADQAQANQCTTQCGSFVTNVFNHCGANFNDGIPKGDGKDKCDSVVMAKNKFKNLHMLQPGDLFASSGSKPEGHTGIYVGKGKLSEPKRKSGAYTCYLTFTPDVNGEPVFIHSTSPVCYNTYDQLFRKQPRTLYWFCRHDACCLDNKLGCNSASQVLPGAG